MYGLSHRGSKKSIRGIPLRGFLCGSLSLDKALHRSVVLLFEMKSMHQGEISGLVF